MKAKDDVNGENKVKDDPIFVLLCVLIILSVLFVDVGLVLFFFFKYEYQAASGGAFAETQAVYFQPSISDYQVSDLDYYDDDITNDLSRELVDDYEVVSSTEANNEPTTTKPTEPPLSGYICK